MILENFLVGSGFIYHILERGGGIQAGKSVIASKESENSANAPTSK